MYETQKKIYQYTDKKYRRRAELSAATAAADRMLRVSADGDQQDPVRGVYLISPIR